MALPVLAERAAQRPVVEEPEEEIPPEPQQSGDQTSVPEQLVEIFGGRRPDTPGKSSEDNNIQYKL